MHFTKIIKALSASIMLVMLGCSAHLYPTSCGPRATSAALEYLRQGVSPSHLRVATGKDFKGIPHAQTEWYDGDSWLPLQVSDDGVWVGDGYSELAIVDAHYPIDAFIRAQYGVK